MKILIIGGTRFVGRYLVKSVQRNGHEITLFNRGQTNPEIYPDIEQIHGDRDGGLNKLKRRKWDAVIDTCGYFPRLVNDSASFLKNRVGQYVFISTVSVYKDHSKPGNNEKSPLGTIKEKTIEEITGESYGPLKVLCEKAVKRHFPTATLIIRPGIIVGPHDPTDRFTYWPYRIGLGGKVLMPKPKNYPIQYIDVRDLGDWTIDLMERKKNGIFNAIGPEKLLTMQKFVEAGKSVLNSKAEFIWANKKFLLDRDVEEWRDLPIWIAGKKFIGLTRTSCAKAFANGLKFRSPGETIKDTYEWCRKRPKNYQWRAGLNPKREKELLREWLNQNK